jgi:Protein of unknown function (DUF3429)
MFEHRIRRTAWTLTLAGLLPFVWFTGEVLAESAVLDIMPLYALRGYGAVILSFMGGVIWMRALALQGNSGLSQWILWISVMPALTGWGALLVPQSQGIILLIAGFAGMGMIEDWFWTLRWRVTLFVILLLGVVATVY